MKNFRNTVSYEILRVILKLWTYAEGRDGNTVNQWVRASELGEKIPPNFFAGSRYFCESLFWASQPKQAAKT
jgi:hypothetical protein